MSRTAQPELSLLRHREKFFKVTEDERKVRDEHKKILALYIDECISNGYMEVIYEVPATITGAFANYDVHEMTIFLARYCRSVGYHVEFYGMDRPTTIRISGWHSAEWLEKNRPPDSQSRTITLSSAAATAPPPTINRNKLLPTSKPKPATITPEEASAMAQRGTLSRHLKMQLESARRGL